MQSEGSSYGPSARDGGLLDSMKTLKSPNRSLQFSEDPPTPPHSPIPPNPTQPYSLFYSTVTTTKNTSLFDSTPFLKVPAVETLNWTEQDNHSHATTFCHWKSRKHQFDVCFVSILYNQLYRNPRHCTEERQQFWCAHKLLHCTAQTLQSPFSKLL